MLVVAAVCWGLAFAAIKVVTNEGVSWISLTFGRLLFGSGLFGVYLLLRPAARVPLVRKDFAVVGLLGFLGFTGYHLLLNYGEATGASSGGAALVIASVPVFVAGLAVFHLREHLTLARVLGLLLAFLGLTFLVLWRPQGGVFSVAFSWSLAAIIPSAIMAAIYSVYSKPYLKRYPPFTLAAYTIFFGTLWILPVGLLDARRVAEDFLGLSTFGWVAFAFLGLLPTFLGYGLWFRALERLEVSAAGAYLYLSTLLALVTGALFLQEPLTLGLVLGGGMILAGVYLAQATAKGSVPKTIS